MTKISRAFSRSLCALAVAGLVAAAPALAQMTAATPGHAYPSIGGEKVRGIEALNNSGLIGTATLTVQPNNTTHFIITLKPPSSKPATAELYRSTDNTCKNLAVKPDFTLKDVVNGKSDSMVKINRDRLLSGNYFVLVREGDKHVACGHLVNE